MVKNGVLESVPVADIELDRTNPRIRKFLEMYPETPTVEQIYLALGAAGDDESESSTSFEKLRNSILTNVWIRKFLEMYPETPTVEQIYLALGAAGDDESESSTSFEKLRNSILTNGGI